MMKMRFHPNICSKDKLRTNKKAIQIQKSCRTKQEIDSPTSSPIPWPSPEVFNISSDEELEQSMIEIEKEVTNGN